MIEFRHENNQEYGLQSFTYVLDCPDNDTIEQMALCFLADKGTKFMTDFGVAKLHPDDNFDKSVGRHVALCNLRELEFTILSIKATTSYVDMEINGGGYTIHLSANKLAPKKWGKIKSIYKQALV